MPDTILPESQENERKHTKVIVIVLCIFAAVVILAWRYSPAIQRLLFPTKPSVIPAIDLQSLSAPAGASTTPTSAKVLRSLTAPPPAK